MPTGAVIQRFCYCTQAATNYSFAPQLTSNRQALCVRGHATLQRVPISLAVVGTPLVQLPPEFDLKHRGLEAANKANSYRASSYNDIFYVPELGDALTTFIDRSDEENRPFENDPISGDANCEQIFIVPSLNATARVGYSREYLKDWRAIQQAWIRKLQSFED